MKVLLIVTVALATVYLTIAAVTCLSSEAGYVYPAVAECRAELGSGSLLFRAVVYPLGLLISILTPFAVLIGGIALCAYISRRML